MKTGKKRRAAVTSAAVTFACGMMVVQSANAMMENEMSVFGDAVELTDEEMGDMRGRYVSGNQLTYFGVEMYTRWTNASGETLSTGLTLGTDVSPTSTQIRPTVSIFQSSENVAGGSSSTQQAGGETAISASGLDNVNGISQGIQVAGDLNEISNDLNINIRESGSAAVSSAAEGAQQVVLVNGPGTTTLEDASGNMVTFSLDRSGFGYTISNPAHDQVTQRVRNIAVDSVRGITQGVQIVTDQNRISNAINIVAHTQNLASNIQRPEMSAAFTSLRGLQIPGQF